MLVSIVSTPILPIEHGYAWYDDDCGSILYGLKEFSSLGIHVVIVVVVLYLCSNVVGCQE